MDVNMLHRQITQGIVTLSIGALLAVAIFGFSSGMVTNADGTMSSCPNMGVPALCHMSPLEHAFSLQNMLTSIPFSGVFAFLIFLLLALATLLLVPIIWTNFVVLLEYVSHSPPPNTYVLRHTLQEAFSNGILNSKAF